MIAFDAYHLLTYCGPEIDDFKTFKKLPRYLQEFFRGINGFVIYSSTYHIRGCVNQPRWHSLGEVWTGEFRLCDLFKSVKPGDIPIGQDLIGNQFLIRDGEMILLEAEIDDAKKLSYDFAEFIKQIGLLTIEEIEELRKKNFGDLIVGAGQLATIYPDEDNGILDFSLRTADALKQIKNLSRISKFMKKTPDKSFKN